MAERPILFSAPMVRALLAGTKTQTRRVVKPQPKLDTTDWWPDGGVGPKWMASGPSEATGGTRQTWGWAPCPYGVPGDRLWVREAHALHERFSDVVRVAYAASLPGSWTEATRDFPASNADGLKIKPYQQGFRPSIHMPRWASRLTLQITDVRVERLNAITEADALAEGVQEPSLVPILGAFWSSRDGYARLWERINGPGSWAANPWVWAVSFEVEAG